MTQNEQALDKFEHWEVTIGDGVVEFTAPSVNASFIARAGTLRIVGVMETLSSGEQEELPAVMSAAVRSHRSFASERRQRVEERERTRRAQEAEAEARQAQKDLEAAQKAADRATAAVEKAEVKAEVKAEAKVDKTGGTPTP